jgi:hypothetical protein
VERELVVGRGPLRAVRGQLAPEQIQQYVTLRGYDHAGHAAHDGH